jgi:hypothetical protein
VASTLRQPESPVTALQPENPCGLASAAGWSVGWGRGVGRRTSFCESGLLSQLRKNSSSFSLDDGNRFTLCMSLPVNVAGERPRFGQLEFTKKKSSGPPHSCVENEE